MQTKEVTEALAEAANAVPRMRGPILTIQQFEEKHPATRNRMRGWILHSDAGFHGFAALRNCVIRVGRSVMLDEAGVIDWLASHSGRPPSPARNPHGRGARAKSSRARPKE
jgi:hypothetical protein